MRNIQLCILFNLHVETGDYQNAMSSDLLFYFFICSLNAEIFINSEAVQ